MRRWTIISALSCGVPACSGLLDVPDDPYLDEAGGTSASGSDERPPVDMNAAPGASEGAAGTSSGFEVGMNNVQRDPPAATTDPGSDDAPPLALADAGVVTPPDAARPEACPTGATLGPSGRCYATIVTALVWADARIQCQSIGAGWDLASIHDAATNELMMQLTAVEAWVGGSDAAFEGNWLWVSDNEPFWTGTGAAGAPIDGAFENWNSDEPNGGGPSDCMRLVAGLGTWADLECTFERPAVCEGPAL